MQYYSTKLHTENRDGMLRFYGDILGLKKTASYPTAILFEQQLLLTETGGNALYFESDDLAGMALRLEQAGLSPALRVTSLGQKILTVRDPGGNTVEIGEAMESLLPALLK